MPRNLPGMRGKPLGTMASRVGRMGSGYSAVIQPVGNLIGIITPLATHPVRGNATLMRPFPQGHWVYVDQFA